MPSVFAPNLLTRLVVDNAHYRKEMGDKRFHVIFNQEAVLDDWSVLVSKDTIGAYLERRKARYSMLKQQYEEGGNIPLGAMNDASFIPMDAVR